MANYSKILYVLHVTLIEIRASENIGRARILADAVHNVPSMVSSGTPEGDIVEKVISIAKRHCADDYFLKLFEKAQNR